MKENNPNPPIEPSDPKINQPTSNPFSNEQLEKINELIKSKVIDNDYKIMNEAKDLPSLEKPKQDDYPNSFKKQTKTYIYWYDKDSDDIIAIQKQKTNIRIERYSKIVNKENKECFCLGIFHKANAVQLVITNDLDEIKVECVAIKGYFPSNNKPTNEQIEQMKKIDWKSSFKKNKKVKSPPHIQIETQNFEDELLDLENKLKKETEQIKNKINNQNTIQKKKFQEIEKEMEKQNKILQDQNKKLKKMEKDINDLKKIKVEYPTMPVLPPYNLINSRDQSIYHYPPQNCDHYLPIQSHCDHYPPIQHHCDHNHENQHHFQHCNHCHYN
jgi:hypothetical protein